MACPDDEVARTTGDELFGRRRGRRVRFGTSPGIAADAEHRDRGGCDRAVLTELGNPVLSGAVGARGPKRDVEIAVGDGRCEVDGQRQRLTDAVGLRLDGMHNDGGGDPAERANLVGPLRMGTAAPDVSVDGVKVDGIVERVWWGHADSFVTRVVHRVPRGEIRGGRSPDSSTKGSTAFGGSLLSQEPYQIIQHRCESLSVRPNRVMGVVPFRLSER